MELHETIESEMKWGVRYNIMRVASGWIYQPIARTQDGKDTFLPAVFVPYDNKFIESKPFNYTKE